MTCTLDHVLRIVAPYLSTDLVGVQQLSAIRQLAGHLPPVVRAAIECRLDAGNNQVDLSQSISDDREKKLLQKFISGDSYAGAGWTMYVILSGTGLKLTNHCTIKFLISGLNMISIRQP